MIMIIFKSLLTFFVIYGLFHFIKDLYGEFVTEKKYNSEDIAIVIKVKNSAESLEATVRAIILKCLTNSYGGYIPDIIIVDMGSDDDTEEISQKICNDYSFVYYTTYDLYMKAKE
ncbi:MAG: glycosyltransferase [Clostridia bacterium]|nr:glycosyltransferase [Clostridia bacterium]